MKGIIGGNSGDIIINSILVKAGRPRADIDCVLEQRQTFVKHAGGVADRRGNTLAAGRGPRKGLRTEERRRRTEYGGWRSGWRKEDRGRRMEEAEKWMRFGSSAQLSEERLALFGQDIGAGLARAFESGETATLEQSEIPLGCLT